METLVSLTQPWADFFGSSDAVQVLVTFLHIGGVVLAGGLALAGDRSTFRVSKRPTEVRREHIAELGALHGPVIWSLGVVIVSGAALLLADVEALLPSVLFWAKMILFAVLLANGLMLRSAERELVAEPDNPRAWGRLRWASGRSVALWGVVLLMGVLLPLEA